MIPTRKLGWLVALGLLLALGGAFVAPMRIAALALDLALALLVLIDFLRTPAPEQLTLVRTLPARAGLGQDFVRVLRVDSARARGAQGLLLELHEEFGAELEVRARTCLVPELAHRLSASDVRSKGAPVPNTVVPEAGDPSGGPDLALLPASGPLDLARVYRSRLRGVHALGDLRVRLRSRMGLLWRQARVYGGQTIEIEPPLLGLRKTLALAASERWRDLGVRRLRRRGGRSEFESLREHVTGDDLRLLDWKAFAKRGRPIVRQYQEERGQELILFFDCGRRMSATTGEEGRELTGWTKLDHALDTGLEIAAVALQQGDRVGCIAFDSKLRVWIAPRRGAGQLERLRDGLFALETSTDETDLSRALAELGLRQRRRALVIVLSDVADPLSVPAQRTALNGASRRHKLLFAALDDPALRAAAEGRIEVEPAVRAAAFELCEERRTSLSQLTVPGVSVLDALPAEAAAPLLAAWLEMKRAF